MASIRNISVVLSANVSGYTRSVQTAASATTKLTNAMNAANAASAKTSSMATATATANQTRVVNSQTAAVQQNTKTWNLWRRSQGMGLASIGRYSAATTAGTKAMTAMGTATTFTGRAIQMLGVYAKSALATMGGFIAIHGLIVTARRLFGGAKDAVLDFNSAITESTAIMGKEGETMRMAIEDASIAIGQKFAYRASEAGEAVFFLASAGLDARQSIAALPVVAAFASAGVMDLAKSTEFLMDAQTAAGLRLDDTTQNMMNMKRVSDVLVQANIMGNATTQQMAEALTNKAAAAARLLGKDVEETTAVLTAFASQGIKGKTAGERLNMAWRDLQTRAIKNREVFERFNVAVFDSTGNMRNTADVIGDLETALSGMSDEQKRATLMVMGFQDRSVMAIMSLLGTSDKIREYEDALRSAGGVTEEIAEKQMRSFSNQLKLMRNDLERLAIRGGQAMEKLGGFLGRHIVPVMQNIRQIGGDVAEAFGPFLAILGKIAAVIMGGTFMLFAGTIERITQFLSEHSYIVSALIALYSARWVSAMVMARVSTLQWAGSMTVTQRGLQSLLGLGALVPGLANAFQKAATAARVATHAAAYAGVKSTGTMAAFNSLKGSVVGVGKAFLAAPSAAAIASAAMSGLMIGIAALAFGYMKLRQNAKDAVAATTEGLPEATSNLEAHRMRVVALQNEYSRLSEDLPEDRRDAWKKMLTSINTPSEIWEQLNSKAAADEHAKSMEEASIANLNLADNVQTVAQRLGYAFKGVAIRAEAMKLGIDLSKPADVSKTNMDKLVKHMLTVDKTFKYVGISAKDMGDITEEEFQRIKEEADASQKAMVSAIDAWIDPLKAYQQALDETKAKQEGFTTSVQVYSDLIKNAEESAKKEAEKRAEAHNESIEKQIEAEEDRVRNAKRNAQDEARTVSRAEADMNKRRAEGTASRNSATRSAQDESRELTRAEEDHLREFKRIKEEEKKVAEDFMSEDRVKISASQFVKTLAETAVETAKWRDDLAVIATQGSEALMKSLREMGEEGIPMVSELAQGIRSHNPAIEQAVADMNNHLKTIGDIPDDEAFASMEEWGAKLRQQVADQTAWLADLSTVWSEVAKDKTLQEELGMTGQEISNQLMKLGPEAANVVDEIATALKDGDREAAKSVLRDFATAQEQVGETMLESFHTASDLAVAATKENAHEAVTAIINELDLLPAAVDELRKKFGLNLPGLAANVYAQAEWDAMDPQARRMIRNDGGRRATDAEQAMLTPEARRGPAPVARPEGAAIGRAAYKADGGTVSFWAAGGENHKAQKARAGDWRVWAEPETGGEAYIPLGKSKRAGSMRVLEAVAHDFGYSLQRYAWGGLHAGTQMIGSRPMPAGSSRATTTIQPVAVPISKETNYNFGDLRGPTVEDIQRSAERKARTASLTGVPT